MHSSVLCLFLSCQSSWFLFICSLSSLVIFKFTRALSWPVAATEHIRKHVPPNNILRDSKTCVSLQNKQKWLRSIEVCKAPGPASLSCRPWQSSWDRAPWLCHSACKPRSEDLCSAFFTGLASSSLAISINFLLWFSSGSLSPLQFQSSKQCWCPLKLN